MCECASVTEKNWTDANDEVVEGNGHGGDSLVDLHFSLGAPTVMSCLQCVKGRQSQGLQSSFAPREELRGGGRHSSSRDGAQSEL